MTDCIKRITNSSHNVCLLHAAEAPDKKKMMLDNTSCNFPLHRRKWSAVKITKMIITLPIHRTAEYKCSLANQPTRQVSRLAGIMGGLWKCLLFYVLTCLGRKACGSEIIKGEKASDGSMPYMVSLQNDSHHHVCGGFLISEDFVLTAAHCNDSKPTRVVLGTQNLKKVDDGNKRDIEKEYKHEHYLKLNLSNDIMLLKLSAKVQLANNVQKIAIPCDEKNINENTKCSVAGWGGTETGGGAVDELRVVDVAIINQQVCNDTWKDNLPANVICAGGYNTSKGFCQGDSGGPLVCNGVAVGIVSFNNNGKCDYNSGVPNVYTDISKYLPWIKSKLNGANGLE